MKLSPNGVWKVQHVSFIIKLKVNETRKNKLVIKFERWNFL